ncbi:acylphosphatase [Liquorilactobacillus sicerae]|uniref:acylphosphatase n=1 Tax=Liquorilactobacillus sicerae TaxID=1416943 RepID=UPI00247FFD3C|nr:acylphosphatase [Liquorilactobacillus sicerae]
MIAVRIKVYGLVQGVGFRYCTKILADRLKIAGIVRNEADGSVYIEAQGPAIVIQEFIAKVKLSPSPSGRVEKTEVSLIEPNRNYQKFRVTY